MKHITSEGLISKYGDTPMYFSSYYRGSFALRGVSSDGEKVFANTRIRSLIDTFALSDESPILLKDLDIIAATVSYPDSPTLIYRSEANF